MAIFWLASIAPATTVILTTNNKIVSSATPRCESAFIEIVGIVGLIRGLFGINSLYH
jgi:hypothetical protein